MHWQPVFQKRGLFGGESYPVSERLAEQGFYIPSGLTLTDEQQEYVIKQLHGLFEGDL
jgi:perosamine synthetase